MLHTFFGARVALEAMQTPRKPAWMLAFTGQGVAPISLALFALKDLR